jgi:hypothetical protein
MTNRRGFLASMFAAAAAPAIVRAESLMRLPPQKIWTPSQEIVTPQGGWEIHPINDVESLFATQLYTGIGRTQTIEHSLGWEPSFIMIKRAQL